MKPTGTVRQVGCEVRTTVQWRAEDGRILSLVLPAKFAVDDLPYEVTFALDVDENEDIVVAELNVLRRPGGRPVTASGVRYWPLEDWQRQAVKAAARSVTLDAKGQSTFTLGQRGQVHRPITDADADAAIKKDPYEQWRRTMANAKLLRMSDETLDDAANVYRTAVKLGDDPTKTVAEVFRKPRNTASRWVLEARRRGFLEPVGQSAT
jgi:hypothetical protein